MTETHNDGPTMTPDDARPGRSQQDWDERYGEGQLWSGDPNPALVAAFERQLADLPAGSAVDVGCGEGADAVWLARRGWRVTALDVAESALARGRAAAEEASANAGAEASEAGLAERITWVHAGLLDAALTPESFNLVSVFYPALIKNEETPTERSLLELVAPGGALLLVAHAHVDQTIAEEHGFDPAQYVGVDDVRTQVPHGWAIEQFNAARNVTEGAGAHHHEDTILIARRPITELG